MSQPGRKKIQIRPLTNAKSRMTTFNKRRVGLMKKAMELAILCGCEVGVLVTYEGKVYQYSNEDMGQVLSNYYAFDGVADLLCNDDLNDLVPGKASSFKAGIRKRKHSAATAGLPPLKFSELADYPPEGGAHTRSSSGASSSHAGGLERRASTRARKRRTLYEHSMEDESDQNQEEDDGDADMESGDDDDANGGGGGGGGSSRGNRSRPTIGGQSKVRASKRARTTSHAGSDTGEEVQDLDEVDQNILERHEKQRAALHQLAETQKLIEQQRQLQHIQLQQLAQGHSQMGPHVVNSPSSPGMPNFLNTTMQQAQPQMQQEQQFRHELLRRQQMQLLQQQQMQLQLQLQQRAQQHQGSAVAGAGAGVGASPTAMVACSSGSSGADGPEASVSLLQKRSGFNTKKITPLHIPHQPNASSPMPDALGSGKVDASSVSPSAFVHTPVSPGANNASSSSIKANVKSSSNSSSNPGGKSRKAAVESAGADGAEMSAREMEAVMMQAMNNKQIALAEGGPPSAGAYGQGRAFPMLSSSNPATPFGLHNLPFSPTYMLRMTPTSPLFLPGGPFAVETQAMQAMMNQQAGGASSASPASTSTPVPQPQNATSTEATSTAESTAASTTTSTAAIPQAQE